MSKTGLWIIVAVLGICQWRDDGRNDERRDDGWRRRHVSDVSLRVDRRGSRRHSARLACCDARAPCSLTRFRRSVSPDVHRYFIRTFLDSVVAGAERSETVCPEEVFPFETIRW